MFKRLAKKATRISIVLFLTLAVIGTSLIVDIPVPTQETEAGLYHRCCQVQCYVDGFGRLHCIEISCVWRFHLPFSRPPC